MSFYNKWTNFVRYKDAYKVWSESERLNCNDAVNPNSEDVNDPNLTKIKEYGFLTTLDEVIYDDDEFEVMEVTSTGEVMIWTKKRVWFLQRQSSGERLTFVPRHPKFSEYEVE